MEEEKAIFESSLFTVDDGSAYCTCTVIDLLYQCDLVYDPSNKLNKRVTEQCIRLFQSYNYKQHLCYGYIANMLSFCKNGG